MSKALWKSTNTSPVSSSLSTLKKILSASLIRAVQWNYQNGRLIDNYYCSLEDILIATLVHVFEDFR